MSSVSLNISNTNASTWQNSESTSSSSSSSSSSVSSSSSEASIVSKVFASSLSSIQQDSGYLTDLFTILSKDLVPIICTKLDKGEAKTLAAEFCLDPTHCAKIKFNLSENEFVTLDLLESLGANFYSDKKFKLSLEGSKITDDQLKDIVQRFPNIVEINARGCFNLTDESLAILANLTSLTSLDLS